MEYFILQQDERYTDVPVLQNIRQKLDTRHMNRLQAHHIADTTIFHVKGTSNTEYIDVLSNQLFLVSERMRPILEMYEPECLLKIVPLIDLEQNKQIIYYLPIFHELEALSDQSEFNLDRSVIKKLILQGNKLNGRRIFRVQESEKPLIIVRLDVAESILRRDLAGIQLKRVTIE